MACEWLDEWLKEIGGIPNCPTIHIRPGVQIDPKDPEGHCEDIVYYWNKWHPWDCSRNAFHRTLTTDIFLDKNLLYGGRMPRRANSAHGVDMFLSTNTMARMLMGRKFMVTADGIMALGPEEAQIGDRVCIIPGSEVPLLLRPLGDSQYNFVGELYVHGLMDGEFWKIMEEQNLEKQKAGNGKQGNRNLGSRKLGSRKQRNRYQRKKGAGVRFSFRS